MARNSKIAYELIWRRAFGHSDSTKYGIIHDSILFYGKGENRIWNRVLQAPDKDYIDTFFDQYDEERKEPYQRLSLSAGGLTGGGYLYEYKGVKTLWRCPIETLERHDQEGRLHWPKKVGGVPRLKKYLSEYEGVPLQDIWTDREACNGTARAILQGRKYGLGCLLITQRTANVTKTILNQCNTVFAMRTFDETGKEFLANYIGKDYAGSLSSLAERHAVLFGKASSCENPIQIRLNDREKFMEAFRADNPPPDLPLQAANVAKPPSSLSEMDDDIPF